VVQHLTDPAPEPHQLNFRDASVHCLERHHIRRKVKEAIYTASFDLSINRAWDLPPCFALALLRLRKELGSDSAQARQQETRLQLPQARVQSPVQAPAQSQVQVQQQPPVQVQQTPQPPVVQPPLVWLFRPLQPHEIPRELQ
jgi:hypothetical protein